MTSISLPDTMPSERGGLTAMVRIEARRFARHPAFLTGVVLAFGVLAAMYFLDDRDYTTDLLSMPVVPAFFIGLSSLVAANRLTHSTDTALEAMGTAPGSEARRTAALAAACLVPFLAGLLWLGAMFLAIATRPPHANEWWFPTMSDLQLWSILIALAPVACLGGGLLGVLSGRWLRFPGSAAAMVVVVVVVDLTAQFMSYRSYSEARLWVPWAMFHSGTETDGTAVLFSGNAPFYLVYLLCLCAAAALVAMWHDRTARTRQLRNAIIGVVVVGLACLALAITTGHTDNSRSKPIPAEIKH